MFANIHFLSSVPLSTSKWVSMNCSSKWWTINVDDWLPAMFWSFMKWEVLENRFTGSAIVETTNPSQIFTTFSGFDCLEVHGELNAFVQLAKPKWMNAKTQKACWVRGDYVTDYSLVQTSHHIINLAIRNKICCRFWKSAPPCQAWRVQGKEFSSISEQNVSKCVLRKTFSHLNSALAHVRNLPLYPQDHSLRNQLPCL